MSAQSVKFSSDSNGESILRPTPCQQSRRLVISMVGVEKEIKINVVVEDFRVGFFATFLFMIVVGYILTKCFVDEDHQAIMVDIFGSTSICTYFDFPPSTYVIPLLYVFPMICEILYDLMSIFRVWIAKEECKISHCAMVTLICSHIYVILSMIWLTAVFAVPPDRAHPETAIVHTLPYANLKIALCVLQISVVWFGTKVAWVGLELPRWFIPASWLHAILQTIVMLVSNVMIINSLGDLGKENLEGRGLWWNVQEPGAKSLMNALANIGSFILAFIIPFIANLYLSFMGFKTHSLIFSIGDNREAKTE